MTNEVTNGVSNDMINDTLPGTVPVPNALFDQALPSLSDTELRVLLVVFRATFGWRVLDENGRWTYKRRDWLSHRQLCQRTGRGGEAVSRAVAALVGRSLVVAEDEQGRQLADPAERRRYLGRVYYRAGDMWITRSPFRTARAQTTTDSPHNIRAAPNAADRARRRPGRTGWRRAV